MQLCFFGCDSKTKPIYVLVSFFVIAAFQCKMHMEKSPTGVNIPTPFDWAFTECTTHTTFSAKWKFPAKCTFVLPFKRFTLQNKNHGNETFDDCSTLFNNRCTSVLLFGWLRKFENAFTEKPDIFILHFHLGVQPSQCFIVYDESNDLLLHSLHSNYKRTVQWYMWNVEILLITFLALSMQHKNNLIKQWFLCYTNNNVC